MRIAFAAFFGLIFGGIVGVGTGVGIGLLLERLMNMSAADGTGATFVILWALVGLVICALLGAILAGILTRDNERAMVASPMVR
jgi:hypothetical protein